MFKNIGNCPKSILAITLAVAIFIGGGVEVRASNISPEAAYAAQWVPNAVKITFNSNGGGVAPDEQIYTYGISRSLPNVCAMQKEGYVFQGWSTSSTATVPEWLPGATSNIAFGYADETKAVAKTLYAVWKQDVTTPTIIETLNSITSFLGVLNKSSTPASTNYDNASLVEKVNYLEDRLVAVESTANTNSTNISTIKSDISTNKTNINIVKSDVSSIKSSVSSLGSSSGVVKSIQRGVTATFGAGGSQTVGISAVDTSKSIIILDPITSTYKSTSSGDYYFSTSLRSYFNNSTSFTILSNFHYTNPYGSGYSDTTSFQYKVGWQVIEFY